MVDFGNKVWLIADGIHNAFTAAAQLFAGCNAFARSCFECWHFSLLLFYTAFYEIFPTISKLLNSAYFEMHYSTKPSSNVR